MEADSHSYVSMLENMTVCISSAMALLSASLQPCIDCQMMLSQKSFLAGHVHAYSATNKVRAASKLQQSPGIQKLAVSICSASYCSVK